MHEHELVQPDLEQRPQLIFDAVSRSGDEGCKQRIQRGLPSDDAVDEL